MTIRIDKQIDDKRLVLGVVEVQNGTVHPSSPALHSIADQLTQKLVSPDWELPAERRTAIRQLLKIGGFSPTGRNKPAHEFLIRDLKERGSFNYINNVVDVNNVVSLESLLPISVFDVAKLGDSLIVRIGEQGEGYIFNPSGQVLDVKRCIVCCRGTAPGEPVGTPVKDSMATKIFEGASHYVGVIYASADADRRSAIKQHIQRFADLLSEETGSSIVQATLV